MEAFFTCLACGFAANRVTSLFVKEDGPFEVIAVIRSIAEHSWPSFLGKLLSCKLCLSVWVSFGFAFITEWNPFFSWLVISGISATCSRIDDYLEGNSYQVIEG